MTIPPDPAERAADAVPERRGPAADAAPVQHCPYCGEHIGSFWGRRGDDHSHWCEACQVFFRVELTP